MYCTFLEQEDGLVEQLKQAIFLVPLSGDYQGKDIVIFQWCMIYHLHHLAQHWNQLSPSYTLFS